jgi:hypothetical protein
MKSCPFDSNPEYISMFHDGAMPQDMEQRFSDHLVTCSTCSEALLNLQNDLFKLRITDFEPVPAGLAPEARQDADREAAVDVAGTKPLFRFIKGVMTLVEGLSVEGEFSLQEIPVVRGEARTVRSVYHRMPKPQEQPVGMYLISSEENRFSLELRGIRSHIVALTRNRRVIEQRIDHETDRMTIEGLERGDYTLMIDDEVFSVFRVD